MNTNTPSSTPEMSFDVMRLTSWAVVTSVAPWIHSLNCYSHFDHDGFYAVAFSPASLRKRCTTLPHHPNGVGNSLISKLVCPA
jgi:hypothetical protein